MQLRYFIEENPEKPGTARNGEKHMIKHVEMISRLKTAVEEGRNQPCEKCSFKHDMCHRYVIDSYRFQLPHIATL